VYKELQKTNKNKELNKKINLSKTIPKKNPAASFSFFDKGKKDEILKKEQEKTQQLNNRLLAPGNNKVLINNAGHTFIKNEVKKENIEKYVKDAILLGSAFKIEPELLLAICSQETGFYPRDSVGDGKGFFQITQITYDDLKKRWPTIKTYLKNKGIDEKHIAKVEYILNNYKLDQIKNNFELSGAIGCVILITKEGDNSKKLANIKNKEEYDKKILKAYNGSKIKERYAKEVYEKYKYLKGELEYTENKKR
jgi:hypothetical protein